MVDDINKKTIETVAIFITDCDVHILDADQQTERLVQLAKGSSATRMKAVRIPYPSEPSVE